MDQGWDEFLSALAAKDVELSDLDFWLDYNRNYEYSNQIEGLQSHIGPATFSTDSDDDPLQATNLSYMIDFLQERIINCLLNGTSPTITTHHIPWNLQFASTN